MAKRDTLQEAIELKEKFEKNHPGAVFVINKHVSEGPIFPGAIEAQGLQDKVLRWEKQPDGREFPIVRVESYEVLEQKTCSSCGKHFQSAAVGEFVGLCYDCSQSASNRRDPRSNEQVQADTAAWLARSQAAEDWYE
jgi:hypothetical protein